MLPQRRSPSLTLSSLGAFLISLSRNSVSLLPVLHSSDIKVSHLPNLNPFAFISGDPITPESRPLIFMKGTGVIISRSRHHLPDEVWYEVLSRLPVRSLVRFRCVSKSWQSLIEDSDFCRSHLSNFKNNSLEPHLFVRQRRGKERSSVVRCSKTLNRIMTLDSLDTVGGCTKALPFSFSKWIVRYSLDGLVLLMHSDHEIWSRHNRHTLKLLLWNPSIRRARTLHVSNAPWEKYVELGFGFDALIKDYKHVRLVRQDEHNLHSIEVYTVGSRSWRTIQFRDAGGSNWRWPFTYSPSWVSVCCKGILYFSPWSIISNAWELVSFDLSTEVFASTSMPMHYGIGEGTHHTLVLFDGGCSLGCVIVSQTSGISIWVFESCRGDIHSVHWNKRYTFSSAGWSWDQFLYLKKDGEMLFQKYRRRVTSYNLETQEEKTRVRSGRGFLMGAVSGYVESLLLLNG